MGRISKKNLKELRLLAKEYITGVKGKSLTNNDLITAEKLIRLGYLNAKSKAKKRNKFSSRRKRFNSYALNKVY
jgi:hypothetical protein